ncbi:MAG: class I adenylate cyclase, partial [Pseudomonas helleri]
MTRPLEVRPALSEGIDRQVLHQVRERFLAVNNGRLQRAMEGLLPAQQTILNLLALLFHVNDP